MSARRQVSDFKKKYGLKIVNSATLSDALKEQGYSIIDFNGVSEKPDVAELIDALQVKDQISHSRGFTYQNDKYRLIFVHEDLNEEERVVVLAHEQGHIWNQHMHKDSPIGIDVIHEHEANEFAHFLLADRFGKKKRNKLVVGICVVIAILLGIVGATTKNAHDKAVYTDDLYRTETGKKYHIKNCLYIRDRTDVYRLTLAEFNSGEYEPCSACMPDDR